MPTPPVAGRDVDGPPLAWRAWGDPGGEPVLLLHGLGGSRASWDALCRYLDPRWRVLAWDMPGYGGSAPVPSGELTFEFLVEVVVRWSAARGGAGGPFHLVGHSMGGMLAQHVALSRPELVASLALIATSPRFGFDGVTTAEGWMADRHAPLDHGQEPADFAARVLGAIAGPGIDPQELEHQCAAMARISGAGLRAAIRCLVTHDTTRRLHEIAAPTLVVVGDVDEETPLAYAEHLAAAIPAAGLRVLEGVGHLAPAEAPAALAAALQRHWTASGLPSPTCA